MIRDHARTLLALFFGSLLYTGLIGVLNTRAIREQNPDNHIRNARSLVHNSTVYSIDNYWYVNQVKNYLEHGRFTVDIQKDRYEVRRTPVYPVFYGVHYFLFGEVKSYDYIRYTQALLLALAVVALYLAVFNFTGRRSAAGIAALLYGLFPLMPVACHYTITESLSSELVCFCLFFLSLAWRGNRYRHWFLAGLTFALAALCRPTIVFLAVPVAGLLWYVNRAAIRQFLFSGLVFSAGALLLFAPWTIRNYRLTGDLILLEKFYGDPMDYGMPNIHLRHWIACWTNPADFTSERVSNLMLINLMNREPVSGDSLIRQFIAEMPARAFTGSSREAVDSAFAGLYAFYSGKSREADPATLAELETAASNGFIRLRERFIRSSPYQYYIVRNAVFLKSIVFQSNASAIAFLDDYTTKPLQKAGRALLYLVSVCAWFSLLCLFPARRRYAGFYWTAVLFAALSIGGAVGYLAYYEARYNVPLFPLLFGCLALCLSELYTRIGERLKT